MARKAMPVSYDGLTLGRQEPEVPPPPATPTPEPATAVGASAGELLKDVAQQYVLYLHPAAHKTIARYALEQSSYRNKVRPHDIIITAIEEYFERNGLPGPIRAKEPVNRRKPRP